MNFDYLIIDFDKTFIKSEALEVLADIALQDNPNRGQILEQISQICNLGMEGKISFSESLASRFKLFAANRQHLAKLVEFLKTDVSDSFKRNKQKLIELKDQIYIISGGFREWIEPVLLDYMIDPSHILANSLIFDQQDSISGFDHNNPLTKNGGKAELVKKLNLQGKVVVLGDGYTDYEIKKHGAADQFVAFCENISRSHISQLADKQINAFEDLFVFS